MKTGFLALVAALGLMLLPATLAAHHSFAAEYDSNKALKLTGTVTKIEWMNPHARIYIDVKDEQGVVGNWELEMGSPNGMIRMGWSRHTLKPGDTIVVELFAARDGTKLGNARRVTLPDGTKLFSGQAPTDGGPQQ